MSRHTYGSMSWRIAGLLFVLGVATRIPFHTDYLWAHDSVLYARAMERFAPLEQRPQAPGYLYYVLLLRAVGTAERGVPTNAAFGDVRDPASIEANRAMTTVSLIAGAAAVALLYLLAARLYDERTARASAVFLLTAVTFWAYGAVAYPYTLLAALSTLCALLLWRVLLGVGGGRAPAWRVLLGVGGGRAPAWRVLRFEWRRGPRLALASAACALAIGFRPDLAVFLAPLWLMAAWSTPRRWTVASAAIGTALVALWLVASAALGGGIAAFTEALREQSRFVDERYSVFANGLAALYGNAYELARFLGRGLYFLAPLLVAVPLSAAARRIELSDRRRAAFVLLWTLTPLVIYLPIHVGEYGYVFSMLPGLCVIAARGAIALARGARMPRLFPWLVTGVALANAAVFLVSDTPLSARDLVRRDRGLAEKVAWLDRENLSRATIIAAYDATIVEHYLVERYQWRGRLFPPPLWKYDPALPRFERVFTTACPGQPPEVCGAPPVLVVWDDLIRVSGSGWQEVRMPHGAKLRVARSLTEAKVIIDGLSVVLVR